MVGWKSLCSQLDEGSCSSRIRLLWLIPVSIFLCSICILGVSPTSLCQKWAMCSHNLIGSYQFRFELPAVAIWLFPLFILFTFPWPWLISRCPIRTSAKPFQACSLILSPCHLSIGEVSGLGRAEWLVLGSFQGREMEWYTGDFPDWLSWAWADMMLSCGRLGWYAWCSVLFHH